MYYPVFLLENNLFYLSPFYIRLWIFSKCSFETGLFFNPAFFKSSSWTKPKSSFRTICRTHICSATYFFFVSHKIFSIRRMVIIFENSQDYFDSRCVWILFLRRGCVISYTKISDFMFFPLFHHDRKISQTVRST